MANQHLGLAKHFTLGRIVKTAQGDRYGHVVGFSLNSVNEIIIDVQFPTKKAGVYEVVNYHPNNLTIV